MHPLIFKKPKLSWAFFIPKNESSCKI
jgi:hypothetical protein